MTDAYETSLSARDIKDKIRALGADLVGIADGAAMDAHPPDPARPRRPGDISDHDAGRVIVIAKRLNAGTTRIARWDERHKYYNDELAISALEDVALEAVLWLEDNGHPALIVPPTHVDPWGYDGDPQKHQGALLSLPHAAVEAGLGTLGLNLQLLTPEFGPRVVLSAILSSVPVEADGPMKDALCRGPACGRCLNACPGDVIGHWQRDWEGCDRYRSPHGFAQLTDFLTTIIEAGDPARQKAMLRSETSFNLWQSILRGSGVVTGCRRCQDVCPVGEDYERLLGDAAHDAHDDPARRRRLDDYAASEKDARLPDDYTAARRWIGALRYLDEQE